VRGGDLQPFSRSSLGMIGPRGLKPGGDKRNDSDMAGKTQVSVSSEQPDDIGPGGY